MGLSAGFVNGFFGHTGIPGGIGNWGISPRWQDRFENGHIYSNEPLSPLRNTIVCKFRFFPTSFIRLPESLAIIFSPVLGPKKFGRNARFNRNRLKYQGTGKRTKKIS